MPRFAWLTDLHLNFLKPDELAAFLDRLADVPADAFLLGGDLAEADHLAMYLERLDAALGRPIYFVLGNHDFYGGSVAETRRRVTQLCVERPRLHYLSAQDAIALAPDVALVGHDGWGDARLGAWETTTVRLNDFYLIADLALRDQRELVRALRELGDEAAAHVARVLPAALAEHEHGVLSTHVPPWREACWHQGGTSDEEWLPYFTCQALGAAVLEIMERHGDHRLTVLCGHTHSGGQCRPAPNIEVLTGGAEYGQPVVQQVFDW
jgi:predicted MPP superfamily phosphohydrolase